jgi:hypothetical protein
VREERKDEDWGVVCVDVDVDDGEKDEPEGDEGEAKESFLKRLNIPLPAACCV